MRIRFIAPPHREHDASIFSGGLFGGRLGKIAHQPSPLSTLYVRLWPQSAQV
jgi:hypothetical protein